jgi:hypothetical protein
MPKLTFVQYDGSDEHVLELLTKLLGETSKGLPSNAPPTRQSTASISWDEATRRFAEYVNNAAAYGRPAQKNAMLAWLKADGEIALTKLWGAAGVKVQHDYAGVGGSLTKNMAKAKGPENWYSWFRNPKGEWIYKIAPELVEPLKRSFGSQD